MPYQVHLPGELRMEFFVELKLRTSGSTAVIIHTLADRVTRLTSRRELVKVIMIASG